MDEPKTRAALLRVIAQSDLVIAVWRGAAGEGGTGMRVIKGGRLLRTVAAEDQALPAKAAVIPCECFEQAFELQRFAGELAAET